MSDIATVWDVAKLRGDWVQDGAQLMSGGDLYTAVLNSIFTDRTANVDDAILDGSGDPRGWVGDEGEDVKLGSRLWLLDRSKELKVVLVSARGYVVECLQWLIDDGVVQKFDITVEWTKPGMLGIKVVPYEPSGQQLPALRYAYVWKQP